MYSTKTGWPISLDMACHKALSSAACSFEFTNVADEDYYLLKRNTPLEGLNSPFVSVSLDGMPLQYEGRYVYRTPPSKDEFVLLKPGQAISATVQINDIFTFPSDGLYNIRYSKPLKVMSKEELESYFDIAETTEVEVSESVSIYLQDTHHLSRPAKEEPRQYDTIVHVESCSSASYIGGTSKERSDTTEAHKKLCSGFDTVKGKVKNDASYITWFGAYTTTRANKVKDVYQKCRSGIGGNTVTYNIKPSDCEPYWYAYTYHGSKTVYLCHIYFEDPIACRNSGTSKEGTLVHEWTHAFGYTDDYVYGEFGVKDLAKSDPDYAVDNAETYEFYYCRNKCG